MNKIEFGVSSLKDPMHKNNSRNLIDPGYFYVFNISNLLHLGGVSAKWHICLIIPYNKDHPPFDGCQKGDGYKVNRQELITAVQLCSRPVAHSAAQL